ncbi:MAG: MBL fold metallo-hydrolase [Acidobacteriota bacterium]
MAAITRIDDGVWACEVALDDYRVRGALVLGRRRALVWDTLSHPRDMAAWLPLIAPLDLVIVYSHADWDHIWGTAGLPHQRAEIVGHRACRARFDADVPATLREKQAAAPGAWDEVTLVPPTMVMDDELEVDLGGVTVELRHLPGHTGDGIVGFVRECGLLLAGDAVETPLPVVPPDAPLAAWIAELERWAAHPGVRAVMPAHGDTGDASVIRRTSAYLRGLQTGRPVDVAEPLDPFYRETHAANVRAFLPRTR